MGVRGAKLGLALGKRSGDDPRDISQICSFSLKASSSHPEITGSVVGIPLTPEDLLEDQDRSVNRMHRAVQWAERDGVPVDVVGLGSLCAVVGSRGQALQERINVPVTTGGAATVWTLFSNAIQVNPHRQPMGVLGSNSPVGRSVIQMLDRIGVPLYLDSKRAAKELHNVVEILSSEEVATATPWVIGCGPTGPMLSESVLQKNATVLDVALPHTFSSVQPKRDDIRTIFAERMSMPDSWSRGLWGRAYHLVSGYGYQTVLACLIEPVVMAGLSRKEPFAQGRSISIDAVEDFGRGAGQLGFYPTVSSEYWALRQLI